MSPEEPLTAFTVTHAMDYGYFTITGADDDPDELDLLDEAQETPPSASDGSVVLVLSPHQNNFAMEVAVELWSARPASDLDDWEQVSVEPLRVTGSPLIRLDSPTLPTTVCAVPEGSYWVEVSGRGFINNGWPGSTEPGDRWRLRFWPRSGPESHPRKEWAAPI